MANEKKMRLEILDGTPAGGKHCKRGEIVEVGELEGLLLICYGKAKLTTADAVPEKELPKPVAVAEEEQDGPDETEDKSEDADDSDPLGGDEDQPLEDGAEEVKVETREELLEKALSLGLTPHPKTGEKKLRAMIEGLNPAKG